MPTYWFDVFTSETWDEARAIGFTVTGFSKTKLPMLKRVGVGDVLICYLKGQMRLIGALRVTGDPYLADYPQIWKSQRFPARLPVEPIVILAESNTVDFVALLPSMSFYHADNMRKTWARLQGSPTFLVENDGQVLMDAVTAASESVSEHYDVVTEGTPPTSPTALAPDTAATSIVKLMNPLDTLIQELETAQRDTAKPARFERAIADAFRVLGFDVEVQGQSGVTDVVVESPLGLDRFRAIVDAKASGNGKVTEGHINWAAVGDHRQKANADYALVVGERFAGGNLGKFAVEFGVALLDVASLVEILRLHNETPFVASDLRAIFSNPGITPSLMADLRQKSATTKRHWELVAEVIRLVDGFSRSEPPISPTLGHLHGALLGAMFVERSLDQATGPLPSQQDVVDVVGFLASRTVRILRPVEPAETAGYRLTLSPGAALQRLRAIERTIHQALAPIGNQSNEASTTDHASIS